MATEEASPEDIADSEDEELWEAERRRRIVYGVIAVIAAVVVLIAIVYGAGMAF